MPLIQPRIAAFLLLLTAPAGWAEEFSIQIASPVAAQSFQMKQSAFVFRAMGCSAPAGAEVSATAEGRVNGERKTSPLRVVPSPTAGVYGVFRQWPTGGVWIVHLAGRCGKASASALVATNERGFIRESSKLFSRPATEADIEASLKLAAK